MALIETVTALMLVGGSGVVLWAVRWWDVATSPQPEDPPRVERAEPYRRAA